jgi:hypothetical protein
VREGVPVLLRGDRAALVMARPPAPADRLRLEVDWSDGRRTRLAVRLRTLDAARHLAHVEVVGVDGGWQAFAEYLGGHLRSATEEVG